MTSITGASPALSAEEARLLGELGQQLRAIGSASAVPPSWNGT